MKRVLVTGGSGFVGRHMVAELASRGWNVRSIDLRPDTVTFGLDARDAFRNDEISYDLVVHAAYHVGGRAAIDGEPRMLARNTELDAALFDWAVRTGQKRVLYFSSSAAYPVHLQTESMPGKQLRESDIQTTGPFIGAPDARYGWAKLTGEMLVKSARESGLPVSVVRPFSGYGEDQDDSYPFRAIVDRAKRRDDPFIVWGPGTQVRDWIHIEDVVNGALAVAESGTDKAVNLCTGVGTSMLELAEMCCNEVGYIPEFQLLRDKPVGVHHRVGDPELFHEFWTPKVSLEEGVRRAVRG